MPNARLARTRDAYLPPPAAAATCRDCTVRIPALRFATTNGLVADRRELRRLGWELDAADRWVCPPCLASDARANA